MIGNKMTWKRLLVDEVTLIGGGDRVVCRGHV